MRRFSLPDLLAGTSGFRKFRHEFDTLRFASGERVGGLTEPEVSEPHVLHELQGMGDRGLRGEKFERVVHRHVENFADRALVPLNGKGVFVKAHAFAGFARHRDVRQEVHFLPDLSLARADRAAPFFGVKGKACCAKAPLLRLIGVGKNIADAVKKFHVGRRARARCLADRGLIDFKHACDLFNPVNSFAARRSKDRKTRFSGTSQTPDFLEVREPGSKASAHHVVRKRRFSGAGNAGKHNQAPQGQPHGEILEVMQERAAYGDCGRLLRGFALGHTRVL